jgi:phage tail tape measure protein, TP901 family, core region
MATIGTYVAEFTANVDGLIQGAAKGTVSIEGLTGSIVKGQLAVEAIGAAAKIAFQAITETLKQVTVIAANYGDEMLAASQKTGIATEALGGLKFAAEESNTSFEALTGGLALLSKNIVAANTHAGAQRDAFQSLGVATKDTEGKTRDVNAIFLDIAQRFKELPDGANKAALGYALMGKRSQELIPLLDEGGAGIKAMTDQAIRFNAVVTKEGAQAGDAFNDALGSLRLAVQGVALTIGTALLPTLTSLINAFANVIAVASTWIKNNPVILETFVKLGQSIISVSVEAIGVLLDGFTKLLDATALISAALGQNKLSAALAGAAKFTDTMSSAVQGMSAAFLANIDAVKPATEEVEKFNLTIVDTIEAAKKHKAALKTIADAIKENQADLLKLGEQIQTQMSRNIDFITDQWIKAQDIVERAQKTIGDIIRKNQNDLLKEAEDFDKRNSARIEANTKIFLDANQLRIKDAEDALKQIDKTNQEMAKSFAVALGNITSDFAKAFTDVIFASKSFGDAMRGLFEQVARSLLNAFLVGLFDPLSKKLAEAGSQIAKLVSDLTGASGLFNKLGGALGLGAAFGPIGALFGVGFGIGSLLFGRGGSSQPEQPTSQFFPNNPFNSGSSGFGFSGSPGPLPVYGPDSPAYIASQRPINSVINIYGSVGVSDIARQLADELRRLTGDSGMVITGAH